MSTLATGGGIVGCVGLAVLMVATRRDFRIAGLGAWAVGLVALAVSLAPNVSATLLVGVGVAGLLVAAAGAALLLRYPYLLPFAVIACVPIRIPVELGDTDANLLLPLYAVLGAYAMALGWQLVVRRDARHRELGPVALPLAALVAWTGVTMAWTVDVREASIGLGAFVLPFGLLAVGSARLPWRGRWLTWLWFSLVATALLYASIGVYQWATREVFWNPKVVVGNAYAPFFRVNSVFWDPSIYGRYLVVGILTALAGVLLGGVKGRKVAGLVVVIVAMWLGLVLSFSQTSFIALAAGVTAASFVVWGRRVLVAAVVFALVVAVATLATPQARSRVVDQGRSGTDRVTSGRASLVGQGVRIAAAHPVGGVGVGGFERAYADRLGLFGHQLKRGASHTMPVTVAAETGLVGLALLGWLLFAAIRAALSGLGRGFTSRVSFAVGLTLFAILVHSLFYSAFFEDPMTWALLGLVGLASTVPRRPQATAAETASAPEPSAVGGVT